MICCKLPDLHLPIGYRYHCMYSAETVSLFLHCTFRLCRILSPRRKDPKRKSAFSQVVEACSSSSSAREDAPREEVDNLL